MEEVRVLEEKLGLLLKAFAVLKADNKRLKRSLAQKEAALEKLQQQVAESRQQQLAGTLAKALPTAREKQKARKQLDAVIHEIDKILTSLND